MKATRERGFTLLELIVAAGIMALIAVFSWRGLDTLIREREAIAASQAAIDVIQRSFARIERDALLATDAALDERGTLRLVAGDSSADPAVEYRFVAGALTRDVVGGNAASLVLLDGLASLSVEAYVPAPGGGSWVRSKAVTVEPPRTPPGTPTPGPAQPNPQGLPPLRGSAAPNVAGATRGVTPPTAPAVAAATGIRFTFTRADGLPVTRAFIVGGA